LKKDGQCKIDPVIRGGSKKACSSGGEMKESEGLLGGGKERR